jgi:hypothetical protein
MNSSASAESLEVVATFEEEQLDITEHHEGLPEGEWKIHDRQNWALTPKEVAQLPGTPKAVEVVGSDAATGDRVVANLFIGDVENGSGSELKLPPSLELAKMWRVAGISPRASLARGGTKAILGYLCATADQHDAWLTVEIQPRDDSRSSKIKALFRRYGFKSVFGHVMSRRPVRRR